MREDQWHEKIDEYKRKLEKLDAVDTTVTDSRIKEDFEPGDTVDLVFSTNTVDEDPDLPEPFDGLEIAESERLVEGRDGDGPPSTEFLVKIETVEEVTEGRA